MLERDAILPESDLPPTPMLAAQGRDLSRDWRLQPRAFLKTANVASEAEYKRQAISDGRIMQHAQIGYRDLEKSRRAWREIYDACQRRNVTVDRYGICLDWAMGLPRAKRRNLALGTGLVLDGPEDFVRLTECAPVAPHFGDFVIGLPSAIENTQSALAAGATSIGNLGQYFTFRLPMWTDDISTTSATVTAIALAGAQPVDVMIHSNLDDGFGALFTDLSSVLGTALLEKYIVEPLLGAKLSHCWGHHFSDPLRRLAFHLALNSISDVPGTMVYGNTVSYRGGDGENYASLANYLLTDIIAQRVAPSGHAINPVPIRENERIPDIDEVIDAQLFAAQLVEHAKSYDSLVDVTAAQQLAERMIAGGRQFFDSTIQGLADAGIDTADAFELLLALRRIGGKVLEESFGAGKIDHNAPRGRRPVVQATIVEELNGMANEQLMRIGETERAKLAAGNLKIRVAATDVHEHGKLTIEQVMGELGVETLDGGVSVDAAVLALAAHGSGAAQSQTGAPEFREETRTLQSALGGVSRSRFE